MQYKNKDRFEQFLADNIKRPYNLAACYDDFERQVCETGSYELSARETKSGHPATILFDREDYFFFDGKEVSAGQIDKIGFDFVETTIIF